MAANLALPETSHATRDPRRVAENAVTALASVAEWVDDTAGDMAHMSEGHIEQELEQGAEQIRALVAALRPCLD